MEERFNITDISDQLLCEIFANLDTNEARRVCMLFNNVQNDNFTKRRRYEIITKALDDLYPEEMNNLALEISELLDQHHQSVVNIGNFIGKLVNEHGFDYALVALSRTATPRHVINSICAKCFEKNNIILLDAILSSEKISLVSPDVFLQVNNIRITSPFKTITYNEDRIIEDIRHHPLKYKAAARLLQSLMDNIEIFYDEDNDQDQEVLFSRSCIFADLLMTLPYNILPPDYVHIYLKFLIDIDWSLVNVDNDCIQFLHNKSIHFPDLYTKYCNAFTYENIMTFCDISEENKKLFLLNADMKAMYEVLWKHSTVYDLPFVIFEDGEWTSWGRFLLLIVKENKFIMLLSRFFWEQMFNFDVNDNPPDDTIDYRSTLDQRKIYFALHFRTKATGFLSNDPNRKNIVNLYVDLFTAKTNTKIDAVCRNIEHLTDRYTNNNNH